MSVLNQLRSERPFSRASIAGELGLTRATVSSIVADLLDARLVSETDYFEKKGGRPGQLLSLNPDYGCMVAIEIDLGRISVILANFGREILWEERKPLADGVSSDDALSLATSMVDAAIAAGAELGLSCRGIGVAWAGLVRSRDGQLTYGPTFGWESIALQADWEQAYGVPVFVENEANAAAIGVYHFERTSQAQDLIYLSLGVGLGAGIFTGGKLLRGQQGFAGQVGHTHFADNGVRCVCGKTGCWVTEVGASAIKRKLKTKGLVLSKDITSGLDWIDWAEALSKSANAVVTEVLTEIASQVGAGVATFAQAFNPSLIVIGGRMGSLLHSYQEPMRDALEENLLPHISESLTLTVSSSDQDALTGCLAMIFDAALLNPNIGKFASAGG